jgi:4-diphosphocytidyl-2-C-methyl-D-erythritol kinase
MITFPNAKINLGLYITEKRSDGFHNIETVFLPVPKLCDILEIIQKTDQNEDISFTQTGIKIDGDRNSNLCVKAYNLISQRVKLPKVAIHLHKQIPLGAGLGGGSADGTFALKILNQLAEKPLHSNIIAELALVLGSDCPFFLHNTTCFASGQGEIIEPLDLKLIGYHILLVTPGIHVDTGKAYINSNPQPAPFNLRLVETTPIEKWKNLVSNDFEKIVFTQHPQVENIKDELYSMGALYASMSGSGSTVYGLFKNKPIVGEIFEEMFTHLSVL